MLRKTNPAINAKWWQNYEQLKAIWQATGNANISPGTHLELGTWLINQRTAHRTGHLRPERIKALEDIGVVWNKHDAQWNAVYLALKAVYAETGDINFPPDHPTYGPWLKTQKINFQRGVLSDKRIAALDELGLTWAEGHEERWDNTWEGLKAIFLKTGNANVPEDHPTHGTWLSQQRASYHRGRLGADKIQALEAIGVVLNPKAQMAAE